jgi:hypothetical protein
MQHSNEGNQNFHKSDVSRMSVESLFHAIWYRRDMNYARVELISHFGFKKVYICSLRNLEHRQKGDWRKGDSESPECLSKLM